MEVHQLRYAVAVEEEAHFGRAASKCHVSQPSLSVQVRKLEEELGGRLFDREGRRVRVTPLGASFLPHARGVLARIEEARVSARQLLDPKRGLLRLGILPTISPYWLPRVLPKMRRRLPRIEVEVREGVGEEIHRWFLGGEIDLAVGSLPPCAPDMIATKILEEEFLLAVPRRHPLASRRRVSLTEASKTPWIVLHEMHCLRTQVGEFCGKHRRHFDVAIETSQMESLLGLVAAGLGVSMVPAMAARSLPGIKFLRFASPVPTRTIGFVRLKDRFLAPHATCWMEEVGR